MQNAIDNLIDVYIGSRCSLVAQWAAIGHFLLVFLDFTSMKWGSLNCAAAAQPDCEKSKTKSGESDLLELDKGIEAPA